MRMIGAWLVLFGVFLVACSDGNSSSQSSAPAIEKPAASYDSAVKNLSGAVRWQDIRPGKGEYHFLIGAYQTLSAVEHILQVRYANYSGQLPMVPGGNFQVAPNPDATFDPAFIETALSGALEHLTAAQSSLDMAVGKEFAIDVNLGELWFDVNANATRDEGEDLLDQLLLLPQFRQIKSTETTVRFDTADADWLAAYVHLLSGTAELVLATDPTPAIKQVTEGRAALLKSGALTPTPIINEDEFVETAAAILIALRGVPDKSRTQAAHAHFKKMIVHNRSFWEQVMLETDDASEWLPNPSQSSAFGPKVDAETGKAWQSVLNDLSDLLEGKTLLRYWRIRNDRESETGIGINMSELLQDPPDLDIILMLQGTSMAPYLEQGKLGNMGAWRDFSRLTGGQGQLFALWFN